MLSLTYSMADQHFQKGKSVGILNVSSGLLARLARHPAISPLTVLLNRSLDDFVDLTKLAQVRYHDAAAKNRFSRVLWDQWGVYRAAEQAGNEWLLLPKGFASFMAPCPVKLAVIVHDAMHDHYGRNHPSFTPFPERWYFAQSFKAVLCHASVILTNTDFTTSEVRRVATELRLPCPPTTTVGIGFSPRPDKRTPKEDSVLVLVSPFPHKRSDLAVDFVERWRVQTRFPGTIECVGRPPRGLGLPTGPQWQYHPRLPDADYQRVLKAARAVVFFSEYEGFGMPPVEAILAGACPVYSDIAASREVMAGAGCPFFNNDFASFALAMDRALAASPDQIARWAQDLLGRHNWTSVETRVIEALQAADEQEHAGKEEAHCAPAGGHTRGGNP